MTHPVSKIEPTGVYTLQQVKDIFGFGRDVGIKLRKKGLIKPVRLGKEYRFLGEDLIELARSGKVEEKIEEALSYLEVQESNEEVLKKYGLKDMRDIAGQRDHPAWKELIFALPPSLN